MFGGDQMGTEYKISVRSFVEHIYSSGSIETGFRSGAALADGSRIHREIQGAYGEGEKKEVFLRTTLDMGSWQLELEGRADGILQYGDRVIIEEIKSTSGQLPVSETETARVHWAQAECYAYMYGMEHHSSELEIRLVYVHARTGERQSFTRTWNTSALEENVRKMAERFAPFAEMRLAHLECRNLSIKDLDFPFQTYRNGQRKLAAGVYQAIRDKKSLYANAPTGIGKTMSTIFPSVKAIGAGMADRIFYLTAKTIARQAAEQAFLLLGQKGLEMKRVTLTAKDKICFTETGGCGIGDCPFAEGYYDRINDAVLDILLNESAIGRDVIVAYAEKHQVCPFEYSLDISNYCDVVICDFNYIFDPRVHLKRLSEEQKRKTVLLVDEAHNLLERAREMYSAEWMKSPFLAIRREYKGRNKALFETSKAINEMLIAVRKQKVDQNAFLPQVNLEELERLAHEFIESAAVELAVNQDENLLDAYFQMLKWVQISKLADDRFVLYAEVKSNDVRLKLYCVDPSEQLAKAAKNFRAQVYFSATMEPFDFYRSMFGGGKEDLSIRLPSPFNSEQTDVFVQPLSTRFSHREASIEPIIRTISQLIDERQGNYLVFFPSHHYLSMAADAWKEAGREGIVQQPSMNEVEREAFLSRFDADNRASFVGFAVLGGIFSEGIDLKGDRLNGVVIVGVGLPQPDFERELIKSHFDKAGRNGYDHAYVYPGMNKVLQAGGRLIRAEDDKGTLILIDDRFLHGKYLNLLPEVWRDYKLLS